MSAARAAVDRLGELFALADVDAVLDHFVSSDDVVYAGSETGEVAVGRTALQTLLEELFARDERYSWRALDVHEVTMQDALLVVADAELTVHGRSCHGWHLVEGGLPYRVSGVLVRDAARWRWRLCQGSEPVAPAAH